MRLCTYIVRDDTGLAPNPYWNYCTLAVCTPNHQGTRLASGDWIAGFLNKARGYRLLYVMQVDLVLGLDDYFHDPRFERKKPDLKGTWQERCGDNFYSRGANGAWVQHRNRFHLSESLKQQDTRFARAFISRKFSYFGRAAKQTPPEFASLAGGRGARVNHDAQVQRDFLHWAEHELPRGTHAVPNDNPDMVV